MGITSLIKEYGEITGRSPGWEKYMSIAEFIEFKKAASQLMTIEIEPLNIPGQEQVLNTANDPQPKTETPKIELVGPQKRDSVVSKTIQKPAMKLQTEPLDELTIFKTMGAD